MIVMMSCVILLCSVVGVRIDYVLKDVVVLILVWWPLAHTNWQCSEKISFLRVLNQCSPLGIFLKQYTIMINIIMSQVFLF